MGKTTTMDYPILRSGFLELLEFIEMESFSAMQQIPYRYTSRSFLRVLVTSLVVYLFSQDVVKILSYKSPILYGTPPETPQEKHCICSHN